MDGYFNDELLQSAFFFLPDLSHNARSQSLQLETSTFLESEEWTRTELVGKLVLKNGFESVSGVGSRIDAGIRSERSWMVGLE